MLPAQDKMPDGGLGNLIALLLQGQALRKGNSAFIDENWKVIADPWTFMLNVRKLSKHLVEEKISEWTADGIYGILADDMIGENDGQPERSRNKPWEKKKKITISKEDINGTVEITLANQVYIANHNIKAKALNQFRRLAAFSNPEFYKKQAMGFSTNGIPRIIHSGSDTDEYVCLPRGLEDKMVALLDESEITYKLIDEKQTGNKINVEFVGTLYPEQEKAATSMFQYDYGILGAAKLAQGVKVSVITIPSSEYPDNRIEPTKRLIDKLRHSGIYVKESTGTHEHFAVIDKEIVWYGSMNMLSREKADDNLIRVKSKEIADELLEIGFGNTI